MTNAEFLNGEIENIPLPDDSVAVVISNCVINLSANKDRVLKEAFPRAQARWAPRGIGHCRAQRNANEITDKVEVWVGCIAGALEDHEYEAKLRHAGFISIEVEPTRVYNAAQARTCCAVPGLTRTAQPPRPMASSQAHSFGHKNPLLSEGAVTRPSEPMRSAS